MQELLESKKNYQYSVSEISNSIKNTIESNFDRVTIKGEISNSKLAPSGHLYLNLKDDKSVLSAICWRGSVQKLSFNVEDGLSVICRGKITTYAGQSKYQIIIDSMKIDGVGALMELLEKRKAQFLKEGLFDEIHKKPIPFFPKVIGVVSSPTGAVIKDILHRIKDRFPTNVILWPVMVQGEKASEQISSAVKGFNEIKSDKKPDVIIVARGGGSIEDLWCFNEENVVRAVFDSDIPVISAVGHETDTTLIDYVSDLRAPTPSAAAEKATPVKADLSLYIKNAENRLNNQMQKYITDKKQYLNNLVRHIPKADQLISNQSQKLDNLSLRFNHAFPKIFDSKKQKVLMLSKLLSSYNYKNVLKRGFTILRDDKNNILGESKYIQSGSKINIEFYKDNKSFVVFDENGKVAKKSKQKQNDKQENLI